MRLRILIGALALIAGLAVYALLVMVIAVDLLPRETLIEVPFYIVAGVLWVWPAARLTGWMQRAAPFRPPGT